MTSANIWNTFIVDGLPPFLKSMLPFASPLSIPLAISGLVHPSTHLVKSSALFFFLKKDSVLKAKFQFTRTFLQYSHFFLYNYYKGSVDRRLTQEGLSSLHVKVDQIVNWGTNRLFGKVDGLTYIAKVHVLIVKFASAWVRQTLLIFLSPKEVLQIQPKNNF